jgi:hypothetical protein
MVKKVILTFPWQICRLVPCLVFRFLVFTSVKKTPHLYQELKICSLSTRKNISFWRSILQEILLNKISYMFYFNPLNSEFNPIYYFLALLAHHFLRVSRIRVKSLTLRLLMSYIYMERLFLMFLDHTQRRTTVSRTPLDEWSARRRDLSRRAAASRSPAEIVGSNRTGGMDICLLWVSCIVR